MTLIEAKIIINKKRECDSRFTKKGVCRGRCSICPLNVHLDQYISAKKVVEKHETL